MDEVRFADRPLPTWYDDAKFGVFVHWGPYAVPCYAPTDADMGHLFAAGDWAEVFRQSPYCEWYLNSLALEGSSTNRRHPEVYGDRDYPSFVAEFVERSRGADLEAWADLFAFAGARYVVPVTKHHDGYAMWDTSVPNPHRSAWHAERDFIGELMGAARARGMRAGLYYSGGIDWTFVPPPIDSFESMLRAIPDTPDYHDYALAQVHELIERYRPSVLWNDIGWPASLDPVDTFAHYYDAVPDGVVNDRWNVIKVMQGQLHADFTTPEYSTSTYSRRKFEVCRGIGRSFGYNRAEDESTMLDPTALVHMVCDITANGGNLLLNAGPTADGVIPAAQALRLTALGWWLRLNGHAIYGTRRWSRAEGTTSAALAVRFTTDGQRLHMIVLGTPPGGRLEIHGLQAAEGSEVQLGANPRPLAWAQRGDALSVELPDHLAAAPAYVLSIGPVPTDLAPAQASAG